MQDISIFNFTFTGDCQSYLVYEELNADHPKNFVLVEKFTNYQICEADNEKDAVREWIKKTNSERCKIYKSNCGNKWNVQNKTIIAVPLYTHLERNDLRKLTWSE